MKLLKSYGCLPYVMRFERAYQSPHSTMYGGLATFGNQPHIFFKKRLTEVMAAKYRHYDEELTVELDRLMEE